MIKVFLSPVLTIFFCYSKNTLFQLIITTSVSGQCVKFINKIRESIASSKIKKSLSQIFEKTNTIIHIIKKIVCWSVQILVLYD